MPDSFKRLYAIVVQEMFVTRRSLEIIVDTFFFPFMTVVLFGLITLFVGAIRDATSAQYLIMGAILWQVTAINQYNMTMGSMWSVWSHTLTNIFIAPISMREYLLGQAAAAFLRTLAVVAFLMIGIYLFFDFNILDVGVANLALFLANLCLFATWLGVILMGLIFRFGTRIQAIAWGAIFLFQPLTASFFPVSVLPGAFQAVAYLLPPTYVFEASRQALGNGVINWRYAAMAFGLNLAYMGLALVIFHHLFRRSKETGQFARNDL